MKVIKCYNISTVRNSSTQNKMMKNNQNCSDFSHLGFFPPTNPSDFCYLLVVLILLIVTQPANCNKRYCNKIVIKDIGLNLTTSLVATLRQCWITVNEVLHWRSLPLYVTLCIGTTVAYDLWKKKKNPLLLPICFWWDLLVQGSVKKNTWNMQNHFLESKPISCACRLCSWDNWQLQVVHSI